jgi:hypothetical protein
MFIRQYTFKHLYAFVGFVTYLISLPNQLNTWSWII